MSNMEKHVTLRLFEREYERIEAIVEEHPKKYENVSHWVRCAIMKKLNEGERE